MQFSLYISSFIICIMHLFPINFITVFHERGTNLIVFSIHTCHLQNYSLLNLLYGATTKGLQYACAYQKWNRSKHVHTHKNIMHNDSHKKDTTVRTKSRTQNLQRPHYGGEHIFISAPAEVAKQHGTNIAIALVIMRTRCVYARIYSSYNLLSSYLR